MPSRRQRAISQVTVFVRDLGPPLLDEVPPATRIAVGLKLGTLDPICAEGSEILP